MFGSKKCMGCREKIEKKDQYSYYEIKNKFKNNIGEMYLHKKTECLLDGLPIVRQQYDSSPNANYIQISTEIDYTKYTYFIMRVKDGFAWVTNWLNNGINTPHKDMKKFMEKYQSEKMVALITFKQLPTLDSQIPTLVPIDDSRVSDIIASDGYKKVVKDADEEFRISMEIRGKDKFEVMKILSDYVSNTLIWI